VITIIPSYTALAVSLIAIPSLKQAVRALTTEVKPSTNLALGEQHGESLQGLGQQNGEELP